jgi:predicted lipoprotein
VVAWAQPFGCDGGGGTPGALDPDVEAVLADVGPEVVEPALARFRADAEALSDAVDAWKAAEAGGEGATARTDAQAAWRQAMGTWQELEVMQVGPAGSSLSDLPGGQDLRDLVYSWPTVSRCKVDAETVGDAWRQDDFFVARNVNVIGLAALETLLFSEDGATSCGAGETPDGWDALGADALRARRADYAAAVAAHVEATAAALVDAWSPDGGDFAGQLAAAGSGDGPFVTQGQALDAVFASLFYLDSRTKERKVARPLGLRDCAGLPCTSEVETTLAGGSQDWIRANLVGFRALLTGGEGSGLDDLLVARGHADVRDTVLAKLDAADAAAAAITDPIDVAVTSRPDLVQALYDAVDDLDATMKGDVTTDLALTVPSEAAGDND